MFGDLGRFIGGTHQCVPFPGQDEQHSPVLGFRYEQPGVRRGKTLVEKDVNARGDLEHGSGGRVVHEPHAVREGTGSVDHRSCPHFPGHPGHRVRDPHTRYLALLLNKIGDADMVGDDRPVLRCCQGDAHRHPGIVELTIVVEYAGLEALSVKHGKPLHGPGAAQEATATYPRRPCQYVVEFKARQYVRDLHPLIQRSYKWQAVAEVGSHAQQDPPFLKGIPHQVILSPVQVFDGHLEITNATVKQLCAATACTLGKIIFFHKSDLEPPAGRVESHTAAGSASPYYQHVKGLFCLEPGQNIFSSHGFPCFRMRFINFLLQRVLL